MINELKKIIRSNLGVLIVFAATELITIFLFFQNSGLYRDYMMKETLAIISLFLPFVFSLMTLNLNRNVRDYEMVISGRYSNLIISRFVISLAFSIISFFILNILFFSGIITFKILMVYIIVFSFVYITLLYVFFFKKRFLLFLLKLIGSLLIVTAVFAAFFWIIALYIIPHFFEQLYLLLLILYSVPFIVILITDKILEIKFQKRILNITFIIFSIMLILFFVTDSLSINYSIYGITVLDNKIYYSTTVEFHEEISFEKYRVYDLKSGKDYKHNCQTEHYPLAYNYILQDNEFGKIIFKDCDTFIVEKKNSLKEYDTYLFLSTIPKTNKFLYGILNNDLYKININTLQENKMVTNIRIVDKKYPFGSILKSENDYYYLTVSQKFIKLKDIDTDNIKLCKFFVQGGDYYYTKPCKTDEKNYDIYDNEILYNSDNEELLRGPWIHNDIKLTGNEYIIQNKYTFKDGKLSPIFEKQMFKDFDLKKIFNVTYIKDGVYYFFYRYPEDDSLKFEAVLINKNGEQLCKNNFKFSRSPVGRWSHGIFSFEDEYYLIFSEKITRTRKIFPFYQIKHEDFNTQILKLTNGEWEHYATL